MQPWRGRCFRAILLVLTAVNAGPLWRDEVNTVNVAQMPTIRDSWHNMESFPPWWSLLLRGCIMLGLAGSDTGIRILGLYVGLFVLGSFWLCARWMGCRAPTLSIALLGALPAFIFTVSSNRAYGLACGLMVLSYGAIWRLVVLPSRARILAAGVLCFVFVHCVFYDAIYLAAMLAGGIVVALRFRQWKTAAALVTIGGVSAASLAIYVPSIRQGSAYAPVFEWPYFSFSTRGIISVTP